MRNRIPNTIMVDGKRMVCRIWDTGDDGPVDRYTVALKGYRYNGRATYPYLAASAYPFHPQGFGQYDESVTFLKGKHLGKRIRFEDCPPQVQQYILQSLKPSKE